jgi:hypothetical protein
MREDERADAAAMADLPIEPATDIRADPDLTSLEHEGANFTLGSQLLF